ncbi:hypothetical protein [Nostoc sp.]|uniref:hypothetical protein n=1 Tax=Nostoc sp. TaxID=1180 RepID=UPI002FFCD6A1
MNNFRTLLYCLNVAYQDRNTFIEGSGDRNFYIAPVISLMLGERTRLTLEGDYQDLSSNFPSGLPTDGTLFPDPNGCVPPDRNLSKGTEKLTQDRFGYRLEHRFND